MGRAKVKLEFITNPKNRSKSFNSRTKILKKKAYELKTLCDVEVCMIIHGPQIDARPALIWPPNQSEIQPLIESYEKQSIEDRKRRSSDLLDFYKDRNKKIGDDLAKLRRINDDAKYPTWEDRFDYCSEEELREFASVLENKIRDANGRLDIIKGAAYSAAAPDLVDLTHTESVPGQHYFLESLLRPRNMQVEVVDDRTQQVNSHEIEMPIHHHQQQLHHPAHDQQPHQGIYDQLDPNPPYLNPMFMMLMNNNYNYNHNHCSQGWGDCNSNFMYNNNNSPVAGMIDNMEVYNPQPPPLAYYSPNMVVVPAQPPPCIQYPVVMDAASSQVHATQMDNYYEVAHFHIKNQQANL